MAHGMRELYNRRADACEKPDLGMRLGPRRQADDVLDARAQQGPGAHKGDCTQPVHVHPPPAIQGLVPAPGQFRPNARQDPCSLFRNGWKMLLRIHNEYRYRQMVKWSRKRCDAFVP